MNENGPDWCRIKINYIAEEMHKNVVRLQTSGHAWVKFLEWLAYSSSGYHYHKQMINDAINLYETTTPPTTIETPIAGFLE